MSEDLNKRDSKQFQKLLKEKDKLEREALVQRMQMRDKVEAQKQEKKETTLDELKNIVPELRIKSRQQYLKHREE